MEPLNDDELNALLQQAKNKPPTPSQELPVRVMHAYRQHLAWPKRVPQLLLRRISVPVPAAVLAGFVLTLIGALGGRALWAPSIVQDRMAEGPKVQKPSQPVASLTLNGLQPVRQIKPRVVRSIQDDQ